MRHVISILAALLLGGLALVAPRVAVRLAEPPAEAHSSRGSVPAATAPARLLHEPALPLDITTAITPEDEEPPTYVRMYVLHTPEELAEINRARASVIPGPRVSLDVLERTLEGLERLF